MIQMRRHQRRSTCSYAARRRVDERRDEPEPALRPAASAPDVMPSYTSRTATISIVRGFTMTT